MASFATLRKAVNLSPTSRALPSGIPYAPLLNVRAPVYGHGQHGHGHGETSVRSDTPPRWTGGITIPANGGLLSARILNGNALI